MLAGRWGACLRVRMRQRASWLMCCMPKGACLEACTGAASRKPQHAVYAAAGAVQLCMGCTARAQQAGACHPLGHTMHVDHGPDGDICLHAHMLQHAAVPF